MKGIASFVCLGLGLLALSQGHAATIEACECYDTEALTVENFLTDEKKIKPHATSCKAGYFVTGFVQKPEETPSTLDQYIYLESVTCCRMCVKD